jgi:hypothetical protein
MCCVICNIPRPPGKHTTCFRTPPTVRAAGEGENRMNRRIHIENNVEMGRSVEGESLPDVDL